jgi:hypothetical protein
MDSENSHGLSLYTATEEMTETDPDFVYSFVRTAVTATYVVAGFTDDVTYDE